MRDDGQCWVGQTPVASHRRRRGTHTRGCQMRSWRGARVWLVVCLPWRASVTRDWLPYDLYKGIRTLLYEHEPEAPWSRARSTGRQLNNGRCHFVPQVFSSGDHVRCVVCRLSPASGGTLGPHRGGWHPSGSTDGGVLDRHAGPPAGGRAPGAEAEGETDGVEMGEGEGEGEGGRRRSRLNDLLKKTGGV